MRRLAYGLGLLRRYGDLDRELCTGRPLGLGRSGPFCVFARSSEVSIRFGLRDGDLDGESGRDGRFVCAFLPLLYDLELRLREYCFRGTFLRGPSSCDMSMGLERDLLRPLCSGLMELSRRRVLRSIVSSAWCDSEETDLWRRLAGA